ncbi:MAG: DUF3095 domain-containing protein [Proteobacteria bacterium]|nr:DUF3095 domain-containing protein [Pseudomonadota bacterium]NOG60029.1 DUF3095 domain-containing protein [Pseudomonadota bacterium]
MKTEHFYADLTATKEFSEIADLSHYVPLPDDWSVVVSDVKNSTVAINKGEYKAVNITGVSVITSILNVLKPLSIPYIFGGDGCSLCVPDNVLPAVRNALIATKSMAQMQFNLQLRIGIVPISAIRKVGYEVLVGKHQVSKTYTQAAFAGTGLEYAENLIKDDNNETEYRIESNDNIEADYTGLECRWDNVPSQHGETISLIVKVNADNQEQEYKIYSEVIYKISKIYGDESSSRPVHPDAMKTTLKGELLKYEARTRTHGKNIIQIFLYNLKIRVQVLFGRICMEYKIKTGNINWGQYKTVAVNNADYRKFDGILREVLSGNETQRHELERYLEERHQKGECVYGIHVSDSALITCMINNRTDSHFHFIDGADGGYAMAATMIKQQLKE